MECWHGLCSIVMAYEPELPAHTGQVLIRFTQLKTIKRSLQKLGITFAIIPQSFVYILTMHWHNWRITPEVTTIADCSVSSFMGRHDYYRRLVVAGNKEALFSCVMWFARRVTEETDLRTRGARHYSSTTRFSTSRNLRISVPIKIVHMRSWL